MKIREIDSTHHARGSGGTVLIGGGSCPPRPTRGIGEGARPITRRDEPEPSAGQPSTGPLATPFRLSLESPTLPQRPSLALDTSGTLSLARAPKRLQPASFLEAATYVVPRIFTVEAGAVAATDGFRRADLKLGVDLGRFRDLMTPYLSSKDHRWWEVGLDVIAANAWDLGGMVGSIISEAMGNDISPSGYYRMRQDIRENGFFGVKVNGFEWKDGNFAGTVNTLHGFPYALLGSGYMRMRGYSPEVALLTGMVANLLVHECFFERYENPKSIYDMALMNTAGAVFGALPGCGMEVQMSLFSKEPTATFYVEDEGTRYSIAFEQQLDFFEAGVPIEDRPVLPWHIELGASVKAAEGLDLGVRLRLTTDENEANDPLRAIKGVGLGASIHYRIP